MSLKERAAHHINDALERFFAEVVAERTEVLTAQVETLKKSYEAVQERNRELQQINGGLRAEKTDLEYQLRQLRDGKR